MLAWVKFGPLEGVFRIWAARKMGREQKDGRRGVGEGKEGNACPQTPWFKKRKRLPTNGAPDWYGVAILIDKCINFAWMIPVITRAWLAQFHGEGLWTCASLSEDLLDSTWMARIRIYSEGTINKYFVALLPAGFSFQDLSAVVIIIDRAWRSNRMQRTLITLHCLWQPRLALLSCFSCPENERPNLRSLRLLLFSLCESEFSRAGNFQTKDSEITLTTFKQRIPISGWFYNSTVKCFF